MKIFIIGYKKVLDAFKGREPEDVLGRSEINRANAFVQHEDRLRFLAARYLTIRLMKQNGCATDLPLSFDYTSYGKPYLGLNQIFFNWSHSGEFISLAAGKDPVGVDIERYNDIDRTTVRYICSDDEWKAINSLEGAAFLAEFYRLWTAKESLLKAKGIGLGLEPSELKINDFQAGGADWQAVLDQIWYGYSYTFSSDGDTYTVSACSGKNDQAVSFEILDSLLPGTVFDIGV